MTHTLFPALLLLPWLAVPARPAAANAESRLLVWDLAALSRTPQTYPTTLCAAPGMQSFFYEGAEFKGRPTKVYAYYAAPPGQPPAGGWPAAVCAHGGGGTAYPDWVATWNAHGYAAISMDLEGHLPNGQPHEDAGPARTNWFSDISFPDHEQWFYHAVADVVRANSLLRACKEINPQKIGATGISWGGTIVSAVAGVDPRFAFVVPVYGCGFIYASDNTGISDWCWPPHMTPEQARAYRTQWDPAAHLPYAQMPMLWMIGFDDPVFPINIFEKSAQTAGGPTYRCYRGHMVHGHGYGWKKPELYVWADQIVKGGPPLPQCGRPALDAATGLVHCKTTGQFIGASVCYTISKGPWKGRGWENISCEVRDGEVVSRKPLPAGVTAYNVNGKDAHGSLVSSEFIGVEVLKDR